MSDQQDVLSNALLKLEDELKTFGSVSKKLKNAEEQLDGAQIELKQLAGETKKAIVAVEDVTKQTANLSKTLIPLAKAIEGVNFPLRLDKIDMAVSTQASTTSSLQVTVERGMSNLNASLVTVNNNFVEACNSLNVKAIEARKLSITILVLLVINLLVGLAAIFYKH